MKHRCAEDKQQLTNENFVRKNAAMQYILWRDISFLIDIIADLSNV